MTTKYHIQELDDATREYLLNVRGAAGEGTRGIYLPSSNWLPGLGLIFGTAIIGFVLWWTLTFPHHLDDPTQNAMLQMAGLLLGGWMIIAAFRVWGMRGSRNYLGHFVYADPHNLYEAAGSKVSVTNVQSLVEARGTNNYNDGSYQNTQIDLNLTDRVYTFTVNKEKHGEQLVVYFNALASLRQEQPAEGEAPASDPVLGAVARRIAMQEWTEGPIQVQVSEEFATLPDPQRAGRPASGILAYTIIIAVAVAGVFVMRWLNVSWRDDAAFELVEKPPPGADRIECARMYLLDPRCTRHRAQVERILAAYYDPVIADLKERAKDKELNGGLTELLHTLKKSPKPVVSVRVHEQSKDKAQGLLADPNATEREKAVQDMLVKGLTQAIGVKLIDIVQAPLDVPSMLEVSYSFVPMNGRPDQYQLEWTVRIRQKPDAEPWVTTKLDKPGPLPMHDLRGTVEQQTQQTLIAMAGPVQGGNDVGGPGGRMPFNAP